MRGDGSLMMTPAPRWEMLTITCLRGDGWHTTEETQPTMDPSTGYLRTMFVPTVPGIKMQTTNAARMSPQVTMNDMIWVLYRLLE